MPSVQRMVEAAKKNKKFSVVMVIKHGYISKEFLTSLCDVLQSAKKYRLKTYMCSSDTDDYFDDSTKAFCEENSADAIIFVQPTVGFCVEAINALVSDCDELQGAQTCVAVPRRERSFRKVVASLKRLGADAFDERTVESLTSIFDIKVKNNKIHLDDKGRFECEGFQPQDIVCVPLATVRSNVDESGVRRLVHTRFTTSNREACGCLLDHLRII